MKVKLQRQNERKEADMRDRQAVIARLKKEAERWDKKMMAKKEAMEGMIREVEKLKNEAKMAEEAMKRTKGRGFRSRGWGKSPWKSWSPRKRCEEEQKNDYGKEMEGKIKGIEVFQKILSKGTHRIKVKEKKNLKKKKFSVKRKQSID